VARAREQVRLEDGLKFDVNKLICDGFWPRDDEPLIFSTQWTSFQQGIKINVGMIIETHGENRGSLGVLIPERLEQWIDLIAQLSSPLGLYHLATISLITSRVREGACRGLGAGGRNCTGGAIG